MAIIRLLPKLFASLIIFSITSMVLAAVPSWEIIPKESSLTFTGTLNGASTSGQFKSFNGEINFDPEKLNPTFRTFGAEFSYKYC